MLETFTSLTLLTLMEIVGPLLLLAALAYGVVSTRRGRTAAADKARESKTRQLYTDSRAQTDKLARE